MGNDYKNLLVVLKLFQNRPHHLTKFLIENNALDSKFLEKINDSEKLTDMDKTGIRDNILHFNSINEMKNYYKSLMDDLEYLKERKTKEELGIELNQKLKNALKSENYEEASRIRDYMEFNNIKRNI